MGQFWKYRTQPVGQVLTVCGAFYVLALLNGIYNPVLIDQGIAGFWLVEVIHFVILPILIVLLLHRSMGIRPSDYGLMVPSRTFSLWKIAWTGLLIGILLYVVYNSTWRLVDYQFGFQEQLASYANVVPEGIWRLPIALYFALTAGIVEEIMYRGLPWLVISKLGSQIMIKFAYVLSSSVLFAAVHWEQGLVGLVAALMFGLVAALIYLKLKNLWPLIIAHSLVDLFYFLY